MVNLLLVAGLVAGEPPRAAGREAATVELAADTLAEIAKVPERGIPPALLRDAHAVAVVPEVVKAGFVLSGRFGRGVLVVRADAGGWSNPVFLTLAGGGAGLQAGASSTDLVLVFRTRKSAERLLRGQGKLALGADAAVAAGPVGRQVGAATDAMLRAEIYSYSRSRGLFAGVSLDGDALWVDWDANDRFYGARGVTPADVLAGRNILIPPTSGKVSEGLMKLAGTEPLPEVIVPAPGPALPPPKPTGSRP